MNGKEHCKILLVEDTLTQAMLFQHMLEKQGFQVKIARSAQKALEQIALEKPDAVLSDINMPEMSGYELCQKIKSDDTTCDITVVLLTAGLAPETIFDCIKSGADELALKGMKDDEFINLLKGGLSRNIEVMPDSSKISLTIQDNGTSRTFE